MSESRVNAQLFNPAADPTSQASFQRNLALVIGIDAYANGITPLRTATNDARKLAALLQTEHHYQVHLVTEGMTRTRFVDLFQTALPREITAEDRLLIYFAGHGIALDGAEGPTGYLIPEDAHPEDVGSFLSMTALHQWLNALPCRHLLLILDCCFAGAFRWSRSRHLHPVWEIMHQERYDRFLRSMAWQVITSAAHDQQAIDLLHTHALGSRDASPNDQRYHSPFAQALFDALTGVADLMPKGRGDGVITATELYLYLRDTVETHVETLINQDQTPGLWPLPKHDKGEFIFLTPSHELNLPPAPPLTTENNPYQGLRSFDEKDAARFFGRDSLIHQLTNKVADHAFVAVLGASGTGKSSLVKAGLVTALHRQNGQQWHILPPLRPTAAPVQALYQLLAATLAPAEVSAAHTLIGATPSGDQQPTVIHWLHDWRQKHPAQTLLLIIDQLEELITLCYAPQERTQFLHLLVELLKHHAAQVRIVVTLRSDFEPSFAEGLLGDTVDWPAARFIVPPMNQDELRQVIEEPATRQVLYFEPATLVDDLINEVIQTPGALPLLSFTLSEMYFKYLQRQAAARASGQPLERTLTEADYLALGGVIGSLRHRAQEEYQQLPDDAHRATMQRVLLRMVALEGSEVARRRVALRELIYPTATENQRVQTVLDQLVAARLLVRGGVDSDNDGATDPYIEPAHEALVRAWDTLLIWQRAASDYLPLQRRLTQAADEWEQAAETVKVRLLWNNDPRLPQLQQVVAPTAATGKWQTTIKQVLWPYGVDSGQITWLNQQETAFIQQSLHQRARLLWRIIGVAGVIMTIFAVLTGYALVERNNSVQNEALAITRQREAEAAVTRAVGAEAAAQERAVAAAQAAAGEAQAAATAVAAQVMAQGQAWVAATAAASAAQAAATAVAAQATAVADRNEAQLQARIARARELAAQVQSTSTNDPLQRILLAIEANRLAYAQDPPFHAAEAEAALRQALDVRLGAPLVGHQNAIRRVLFSPDRRWLASASDDQTIRLWQVADPAADPFVLQGHEGLVYAIAFSPDGAWLASGSTDATVRIWSLTDLTAKPIVLRGHENPVTLLVFSPAGQWLASASGDAGSGAGDPYALLWDMQELTKKPRKLAGHTGFINDLAISADGKWLATGSDDQSVLLWQLQNLASGPSVVRNSNVAIWNVAFSPDSRWLASSGYTGNALWSLTSKEPLSITLDVFGPSYVANLVFSPDSRYMAQAHGADALIWDMADLTLPPRTLSGAGSTNRVAFSADGAWLAATSDNMINLWSMNSAEPVRTILRGHEEHILSLAISPDNRWLATGGNDFVVRLWPLDHPAIEPDLLPLPSDDGVLSPNGEWFVSRNGEAWHLTTPLTQPVLLPGRDQRGRTTAFSPDGQLFAVAGTAIRIWDLTQITAPPLILTGGQENITIMAFSHDKRWLATGTGTFASRERTGEVHLWDLNAPQQGPLRLTGHESAVHFLRFSQDGRWLATVSSEPTMAQTSYIRLWSLADLAATPLVLSGHESFVPMVAFSPDGRWLASVGYATTLMSNDMAQLWDLQSPHLNAVRLNSHTDSVTQVAFSPDGHWVATGGWDQSVFLQDMTDLAKPPIGLHDYEAHIAGLLFSPDSRWLATSSEDGVATIIDMQHPLDSPIIHRQIGAPLFSADGRTLLARSEAGLYRWTMGIDALVEKACTVVGRNLKLSEWTQYFPNQEYRKSCPDLPVYPDVVATPFQEALALLQAGDIQEAKAKMQQAMRYADELGMSRTIPGFGELSTDAFASLMTRAATQGVEGAASGLLELLPADVVDATASAEATYSAAQRLTLQAILNLEGSEEDKAVTALQQAVDLAKTLDNGPFDLLLCFLGKDSPAIAMVEPACQRTMGRGRPLAVGETVTGTVGITGGDLWLLTGKKGQVVTIDLAAADPTAYDATVVLYTTAFAPLAENDDQDGSTDARIDYVVFPADGDYYVAPNGFVDGTHIYTLTVKPASGDLTPLYEGIFWAQQGDVTRAIDKLTQAKARNRQLDFDPIVQAQETALDALIERLATTPANDDASDQAAVTVRQALDLAQQLQSIAGTLDICQLGEQAHLRKFVAPACEQLRQKATALTAEQLLSIDPQNSNIDAGKPVVFTETVTSTGGQLWTFAGQSSQILIITQVTNDEDLQPRIILFDPNFAPLTGLQPSNEAKQAVFIVALPTDGQYLLSTDGANGSTGDYILLLAKVVESAKPFMVQGFLSDGRKQVKAGKIESALLDYTFAITADPEAAIAASEWDTLCWQGALQGYAAKVVDDACERAVAAATENWSAAYRDSRGLARALTGDVAGALEDFHFFVVWGETHQQYTDHLLLRREWIAALQSGIDPQEVFDEATLAVLK